MPMCYLPWCGQVAGPFDRLVLQDHVTKDLYLQYHNGYGHQIWYGDDLPWGAPICVLTWPFNYGVLLDHVTNSKHYISTTTISLATKLGKVVIYHEELLLIKLLDPSITCLYKVTWHVKYFISPFALDMKNGHETWQFGYSPWQASTHKFTLPFKLVCTRGHVTN